jgi:hypothetical protein
MVRKLEILPSNSSNVRGVLERPRTWPAKIISPRPSPNPVTVCATEERKSDLDQGVQADGGQNTSSWQREEVV